MIFLSKYKKELQELEEKIEEEKQKQIAKRQLEGTREIATKGFTQSGLSDFFENKAVRTSLLALLTFLGLFCVSALLFFSIS